VEGLGMSRRTLLLLTLMLVAGAAQAVPLPRFSQPNAIWNQNIKQAPTRTNSLLMMQRLEAIAATHAQAGKWGDHRGNVDFQLDIYDFYVMHATSTTPVKPIVAWPDAPSYYNGECEDPGMLFPVPAGGGIEGTGPPPAYSCDAANNDCHMLVVNDTSNIMFEAYNVNSVDSSGVNAICGLYWNLSRVYPKYGRGEHCTSADGAGFPIAPLLFNADEVLAAKLPNGTGDLGHAIRFAIGNERMMQGAHVHPSSHGTSATSDTDTNAVPYGSRLRLRGDFPVDTFTTNEAVKVVLRTLQNYGMFLSDGGAIPLMGETDYFTSAKWGDADIAIDSHSFFGINPTDFDVIDAGPPISNSGSCALTPADFLFIDGFDW
jgi:serine/threonine-protein kinase